MVYSLHRTIAHRAANPLLKRVTGTGESMCTRGRGHVFFAKFLCSCSPLVLPVLICCCKGQVSPWESIKLYFSKSMQQHTVYVCSSLNLCAFISCPCACIRFMFACRYPIDPVSIVTAGFCLCCVESCVRQKRGREKSSGCQVCQLFGPSETGKWC